MRTNDAIAILRSGPRQPKWLVLGLSWLVPGYGFFVHGLRRRAVVLFLAIEGTFAVGCFLKGGVFLPEFRWGHEGFNIVTLLTFFTQIFNGGGALLSLVPEILGSRWAILPYDEASCWADLGSFYMLVAGGLNYFVLMSTFDYFYGKKQAVQADAMEGES
jgi:hypothetical protein